MDFFIEHALAVSLFAAGIVIFHVSEYIFRRKKRLAVILASLNFALHIGLVVFFLIFGANMEQLLIVLLLSLSVGYFKREA